MMLPSPQATARRTKLDKWIERGFMGFVTVSIGLAGWAGGQVYDTLLSFNKRIAVVEETTHVHSVQITDLYSRMGIDNR